MLGVIEEGGNIREEVLELGERGVSKLGEVEGNGGEGMGDGASECRGASQLSVVLGSIQTVVLGSRLMGCSSKRLRKVTWKELNMLPSIVSHSQ